MSISKVQEQQGFTLIELMIVVLIIGILVGIAVPVFLFSAGDAKAKRCMSDRRTIKGASNNYAARNAGTYPDLSNWREDLQNYIEHVNDPVATQIKCSDGGVWTPTSGASEPLDLRCSLFNDAENPHSDI
ncbi:MAG: hypothetical protein A2V52_08450 [Actinobacteria bacterium RBG_19FT_COMBO_54_7]|uniref:Prepilin-type N-terminal cleavage/methylation domain-containing protein n=1 Tax=Candidatus Solincola sediminis TaxID=1797199 RepID=A0A1F2WRK1_9ACTN|nr:MAG: hypothetical protein A2Y75_11375 [Candidatus Solincola sediminis]OFW68229.1 MAG: hypothetical protein A2V52_08450 [Actinobacteria bacterium RBG_19FT_COMBO_54_7]